MQPLQLHSSYFRGEAVINGFQVDGYACDGHNHFIFEYLGCEIHVRNYFKDQIATLFRDMIIVMMKKKLNDV